MRKNFVFGLVAVVLLAMMLNTGFSASWLSGWEYRIPINVSNPNSNDLNNFQVNFTINYQNGMNPDFSDIRFTDANGNEIPYWIENYTPNENATVWIKVPYIPANGQTTIYMYYDNPNAVSNSNPHAVFDLYDDFTEKSLNTTIWTFDNEGTGATEVLESGKLVVSMPLGKTSSAYLYTNSPIETSDDGYVVNVWAKMEFPSSNFYNIQFNVYYTNSTNLAYLSSSFGAQIEDYHSYYYSVISGSSLNTYINFATHSASDNVQTTSSSSPLPAEVGVAKHTIYSYDGTTYFNESVPVDPSLYLTNVVYDSWNSPTSYIDGQNRYLVLGFSYTDNDQESAATINVSKVVVRKYAPNEPIVSYGTPQKVKLMLVDNLGNNVPSVNYTKVLYGYSDINPNLYLPSGVANIGDKVSLVYFGNLSTLPISNEVNVTSDEVDVNILPFYAVYPGRIGILDNGLLKTTYTYDSGYFVTKTAVNKTTDTLDVTVLSFDQDWNSIDKNLVENNITVNKPLIIFDLYYPNGTLYTEKLIDSNKTFSISLPFNFSRDTYSFYYNGIWSDTIAPHVTLNYPVNGTYYYQNITSINVTATDSNTITSVIANIDGINYTLSGVQGTHYYMNNSFNLGEGTHKIIVYATDNYNNTRVVSYTIDIFEKPTASISAPEYVNSSSEVQLSIYSTNYTGVVIPLNANSGKMIIKYDNSTVVYYTFDSKALIDAGVLNNNCSNLAVFTYGGIKVPFGIKNCGTNNTILITYANTPLYLRVTDETANMSFIEHHAYNETSLINTLTSNKGTVVFTGEDYNITLKQAPQYFGGDFPIEHINVTYENSCGFKNEFQLPDYISYMGGTGGLYASIVTGDGDVLVGVGGDLVNVPPSNVVSPKPGIYLINPVTGQVTLTYNAAGVPVSETYHNGSFYVLYAQSSSLASDDSYNYNTLYTDSIASNLELLKISNDKVSIVNSIPDYYVHVFPADGVSYQNSNHLSQIVYNDDALYFPLMLNNKTYIGIYNLSSNTLITKPMLSTSDLQVSVFKENNNVFFAAWNATQSYIPKQKLDSLLFELNGTDVSGIYLLPNYIVPAEYLLSNYNVSAPVAETGYVNSLQYNSDSLIGFNVSAMGIAVDSEVSTTSPILYKLTPVIGTFDNTTAIELSLTSFVLSKDLLVTPINNLKSVGEPYNTQYLNVSKSYVSFDNLATGNVINYSFGEFNLSDISSLTDGLYLMKVCVYNYLDEGSCNYKEFYFDNQAPTITENTEINGDHVAINYKITDNIALGHCSVIYPNGTESSINCSGTINMKYPEVDYGINNIEFIAYDKAGNKLDQKYTFNVSCVYPYDEGNGTFTVKDSDISICKGAYDVNYEINLNGYNLNLNGSTLIGNGGNSSANEIITDLELTGGLNGLSVGLNGIGGELVTNGVLKNFDVAAFNIDTNNVSIEDSNIGCVSCDTRDTNFTNVFVPYIDLINSENSYVNSLPIVVIGSTESTPVGSVTAFSVNENIGPNVNPQTVGTNKIGGLISTSEPEVNVTNMTIVGGGIQIYGDANIINNTFENVGIINVTGNSINFTSNRILNTHGADLFNSISYNSHIKIINNYFNNSYVNDISPLSQVVFTSLSQPVSTLELNTYLSCTNKSIIGGCYGGNRWSHYYGNFDNEKLIGDTPKNVCVYPLNRNMLVFSCYNIEDNYPLVNETENLQINSTNISTIYGNLNALSQNLNLSGIYKPTLKKEVHISIDSPLTVVGDSGYYVDSADNGIPYLVKYNLTNDNIIWKRMIDFGGESPIFTQSSTKESETIGTTLHEIPFDLPFPVYNFRSSSDYKIVATDSYVCVGTPVGVGVPSIECFAKDGGQVTNIQSLNYNEQSAGVSSFDFTMYNGTVYYTYTTFSKFPTGTLYVCKKPLNGEVNCTTASYNSGYVSPGDIAFDVKDNIVYVLTQASYSGSASAVLYGFDAANLQKVYDIPVSSSLGLFRPTTPLTIVNGNLLFGGEVLQSDFFMPHSVSYTPQTYYVYEFSNGFLKQLQMNTKPNFITLANNTLIITTGDLMHPTDSKLMFISESLDIGTARSYSITGVALMPSVVNGTIYIPFVKQLTSTNPSVCSTGNNFEVGVAAYYWNMTQRWIYEVSYPNQPNGTIPIPTVVSPYGNNLYMPVIHYAVNTTYRSLVPMVGAWNGEMETAPESTEPEGSLETLYVLTAAPKTCAQVSDGAHCDFNLSAPNYGYVDQSGSGVCYSGQCHPSCNPSDNTNFGNPNCITETNQMWKYCCGSDSAYQICVLDQGSCPAAISKCGGLDQPCCAGNTCNRVDLHCGCAANSAKPVCLPNGEGFNFFNKNLWGNWGAFLNGNEACCASGWEAFQIN